MLQANNNRQFVGTSFDSGRMNMSGDGRTNTHKRKSSKQQSNYKQRKSSMSGRNNNSNSIHSDNESTGESENCDNNKIVLETRYSIGLTHKQDKKLPHFLRKLWTMLHEPKISHIIKWHEENKHAFVILDKSKFCSEILHQYYKHSNFNSFVRQLNMYQFRKLRNSGSSLAWYNEKLLKGNANSLCSIKRRENNDSDNFNAQYGIVGERVTVSVEEHDAVVKRLQKLETEFSQFREQTALQMTQMRNEFRQQIRSMAFQAQMHTHQSHSQSHSHSSSSQSRTQSMSQSQLQSQYNSNGQSNNSNNSKSSKPTQSQRMHGMGSSISNMSSNISTTIPSMQSMQSVAPPTAFSFTNLGNYNYGNNNNNNNNNNSGLNGYQAVRGQGRDPSRGSDNYIISGNSGSGRTPHSFQHTYTAPKLPTLPPHVAVTSTRTQTVTTTQLQAAIKSQGVPAMNTMNAMNSANIGPIVAVPVSAVNAVNAVNGLNGMNTTGNRQQNTQIALPHIPFQNLNSMAQAPSLSVSMSAAGQSQSQSQLPQQSQSQQTKTTISNSEHHIEPKREFIECEDQTQEHPNENESLDILSTPANENNNFELHDHGNGNGIGNGNTTTTNLSFTNIEHNIFNDSGIGMMGSRSRNGSNGSNDFLEYHLNSTNSLKSFAFPPTIVSTTNSNWNGNVNGEKYDESVSFGSNGITNRYN